MDFGAVHADGIVSSDIVGYSTDSLTSGNFNMAGVTFNNIGSDATFNLNDINIANATGSDQENTSDLVQIWNPTTSGYTTFYKYYEAEYPEDEGWYDAGGDAEPVVEIGMAFWYRARSGADKSITFSGAIEGADDVTVDLTAGNFNMVINPFPTAIDLNDDTTVTIANATGSDQENTSDLVQVWNPATSGYTTFYKYYEAEYPEDEGWYDAGGDAEPQIPAGTAFWYRARSGSNKAITFPNPTK